MMSAVVTFLIKAYQCTLAAVLGGQCRFHPSCSNYCLEAVASHGCGRGLILGARRVMKCHPFHPGGVDPVPERSDRLKPGHRTGAHRMRRCSVSRL